MTPIFSIIIPTFNRALFLNGAIQSVLAQTYEDWELVIVDDGSTDNTREVVESFNDSRIRYVYQENAERSAARNNGIRHATGQWICFLDSDDAYKPDHLEKLFQFIQVRQPKPGMLCSGLEVLENNLLRLKPALNMSSKNILREIWTKFLIPTQVCVHHQVLHVHGFDTRFRLWEDTHLWLRIAAQFPVYQLEDVTCIQHIHRDSTVQQGMKQVQWNDVQQYIAAIDDLFINHSAIISPWLTATDQRLYKDNKYRMYLYQARKNRQIILAFKIWQHAINNRPSLYLWSELLKIPLG